MSQIGYIHCGKFCPNNLKIHLIVHQSPFSEITLEMQSASASGRSTNRLGHWQFAHYIFFWKSVHCFMFALDRLSRTARDHRQLGEATKCTCEIRCPDGPCPGMNPDPSIGSPECYQLSLAPSPPKNTRFISKCNIIINLLHEAS
jgi:hypothetical protein